MANYEKLSALITRLDGSNKTQQFRDSSPDNATLRSSATVTELLQAVSEWITRNTVGVLRKAQFIGILADESTDNQTRNEFSIFFHLS